MVVWPGKAAVDSLVDRLSKGGKPNFSILVVEKMIKLVSPTFLKENSSLNRLLLS